jgi:hypothetical protein
MASGVVEVRVADIEPVTGLIRAACKVTTAWQQVCRCTDEFEPEQPEACAEYRDLLDTAVDELATLIEREFPERGR